MFCVLNFLLLIVALTRGDDSTHTVLAFSRKLQTCDEQDRNIEETGATKVIWSYADVDPSSDQNIPIHTHRGSKTVHFTNTQPNIQLPPDLKYFTVEHHDNTPDFHRDPRTRYDCSAHLAQLPDAPIQIVRAEPVIDPRNLRIVHHMIIYVCYGEISPADLNYVGDCFEPLPESFNCKDVEMVMEWAIGGTTFDWPPHVGYRLEGGPKYFTMEIHYDNADHRPVTDSSGMKFYYTEKNFRQYDGAITSIGWNSADGRISLPGGQKRYQLDGWCYSDCTKRWPQGGIQVVAAKLHTHLRGRAGTLRVIRGGQELPPVYNDTYYDFDFQDFAVLPQEYTILPGDVVKQECVYDTSDTNEPVYFGVATTNEMCHSWVMYYPKLPEDIGMCRYANFDFVPGEEFKGLANFCGDYDMYNLQPIGPFVQYVPPSCVYSPPDPTLVTPHYQSGIVLSSYQQKLALDDKYTLYWSVDVQNRVLNAAVDVQTAGWVGFGLGPYGMEGADIAMGWIKEQTVSFSDRFSKTTGQPPVDVKQDYFNVLGEERSQAKSLLETTSSRFLKGSLSHSIPSTSCTIPNLLLYNSSLVHRTSLRYPHLLPFLSTASRKEPLKTKKYKKPVEQQTLSSTM